MNTQISICIHGTASREENTFVMALKGLFIHDAKFNLCSTIIKQIGYHTWKPTKTSTSFMPSFIHKFE